MRLLAFFNPKIKLFVAGRKTVFPYLESNINLDDNLIWIHCASLGEFEQGLPIIEKLKIAYPDDRLLVTFFSPSGFEVKKNSALADYVIYLPLDTNYNVKRFLALVKPRLVIFVKYEIWPNYMKTLKKQGIPTLLVSAIFKDNQVFFQWYGGIMRNCLKSFSHIFVQDIASQTLLNSLSIQQVSVAGDTRFDRVSEILEQDNRLEFMSNFMQNLPCLIAGSTWQEDEIILVNFINASSVPLKYVLAPHTIKKEKIAALKSSISKKTILFSEIVHEDLYSFDVLILDTIGMLTKVYSYATLAYVGGGFATGLHNTLEPAVFSIPIIIGPNFRGFKEVEDLVTKKGIFPIKTGAEFTQSLTHFLTHQEQIEKAGMINASYVQENRGATLKIMNYIQTILPKTAAAS